MKVERREWSIAALIAFSVTLLQQIPYALGYWLARPGTAYTGLLVNLSDVTYYVAIQLGIQGEWLYRIRFTSEPHAGAFLYTFYLALGHLASVLGLDAEAMWHLSRGVCAFVMFIFVFGFISFFIRDPKWRRVAFILALIGAGLDLFRFPWESFDPVDALPLDWRMQEAHLFFSAFGFPHYSAAISCIVILFWCVVRALTEACSQLQVILLGIGAALANVGVALVYPFLIILTASVSGMFCIVLMVRARKILWRQGIWLTLVFVPALPLLIYYQQTLATNQVIRLWNEQVLTFSPNAMHYLMTYGLYLAPALWNVRRAGFGNSAQAPRRIFLWTWVGVVAILLYVPINAQRRFVEGVHVPLVILATIGLYETVLPRVQQACWFQKLAQRPGYSVAGLERLLLFLLGGVAATSSVFLFVSAVAQNVILQPYPFFRPESELAAMDWLRVNAQREQVVLTTYDTGAWIPYRADTRTYVGQYYETIHFFEKFRAAESFFDRKTTDTTRLDLLKRGSIAYVLYGPSERASGTYDPLQSSFLERVYANSDAAVYRVVLP